MAKKFFGETVFDAGEGRMLTLRYDFNALAEAEDALPAGRTMATMQKDASKGHQRLKDARALLYGCLRAHHPEISVEEAGDLLLTTEGRAGDALRTAAMHAHDIPEASAEGKAPGRSKPASKGRGTGTRSSRPGRKRG